MCDTFAKASSLKADASCYYDLGQHERAAEILEDESGKFLEAAELARCRGDVLKEIDLLEKAGCAKEGTFLLLRYVFYRSLWGNGNKGWPLKQFSEKEHLCEKAKSLAKRCSQDFYETVICSELKLLSDQRGSLLELKNDLDVSKKNKSLRGEIFLTRKILDRHIRLNPSKYEWEDELPIDINKHCNDMTVENQVSVRTLVFYWNAWKENVLNILKCLESEEPNDHSDFVLDYFGVRKQCVEGNIVYMLVDKHADWIRKAGVYTDGKLLTTDFKNLVLSMMSYWQTELFSVGIEVLEDLERLSKSKSEGSPFHQSTALLHIFSVYNSLSGCGHLNLNAKDTKKLERFLPMCRTYIDLVFPLDCRRSVSYDLVSSRETDLSSNLLDKIIHHMVQLKDDMDIRSIGRVMMVCVSSKTPIAHYKRIVTRMQRQSTLVSFFKEFMCGAFKNASVAQALQNCLSDPKTVSGMSINSYVHLLECLLFMVSFSSKIFCTTRSSFVRWFTHIHSTSAPKHMVIADDALLIITVIIRKILSERERTSLWIKRSGLDPSYYLPMLSMKLIMMLSLLHLQEPEEEGDYDMLCGSGCTLPDEFKDAVDRRRKDGVMVWKVEVIAEVFRSIDDPLVIVCSGNESPKIHAPCAMFVDLAKSKEEIMSVLFPRENMVALESSNTTDSKATCDVISSDGRDAKNKKGKGKKNTKNNGKKK